MSIHTGTILISSPSLEDAHFNQAVILITAHNEKGAMGFVINQLFSRPLNHLEEFKQGIAFPIYDGGPMDREHLFFVHQRPGVIDGGEHLHGNLYLGGDFKKAVNAINQNIIGQQDIKIFIGYCGWDYGQLEAELEEGSWLPVNTAIESIFSPDNSLLWQKLYETNRQP
jgi:putative transcriptional regulator